MFTAGMQPEERCAVAQSLFWKKGFLIYDYPQLLMLVHNFIS